MSRRDTVKSGRIEVLNKLGLHARAAAQVVRIASGFESEISLHNSTRTAEVQVIVTRTNLETSKIVKLQILISRIIERKEKQDFPQRSSHC